MTVLRLSFQNTFRSYSVFNSLGQYVLLIIMLFLRRHTGGTAWKKKLVVVTYAVYGKTNGRSHFCESSLILCGGDRRVFVRITFEHCFMFLKFISIRLVVVCGFILFLFDYLPTMPEIVFLFFERARKPHNECFYFFYQFRPTFVYPENRNWRTFTRYSSVSHLKRVNRQPIAFFTLYTLAIIIAFPKHDDRIFGLEPITTPNCGNTVSLSRCLFRFLKKKNIYFLFSVFIFQ